MTTSQRALLLFAALASQGCAVVRLTQPVVVEERTIARRNETVVMPDVRASVKQSGTRVEIVAGRSCALKTYADVRRTLRRERYNAAAGDTFRLGLAGGLMTAGGALLVALPYTGARGSRAMYLGTGIPLGALGVTLSLAAIADVVKSSGSVEEIDVVAVDEGLAAPSAPCRGLPHAADFEAVVGQVTGDEGTSVPLGKTDLRGRLEIDLASLPPSVLRRAAEPPTMIVRVAGAEVGTVDLREAARAAEESAFHRADTAACEKAPAIEGCASVVRYLDEYPDGAHAAFVREALARAQAQIRARAEIAAQEEAARARLAARRMAEESRRAAAIEAAAGAARKEAAKQCRATCRTACGGAPECVAACVERSCE
jgi:hypothetical protein